MKKFYELMTASLIVLTACSDNSSTGTSNLARTTSFETDGCKRNSLLSKSMATTDELNAMTSEIIIKVPEARLIQNGDSYQIEILDVMKDCGFSSDTPVTVERVGDALNLKLESDDRFLANCGSCYYDIRVNIGKEDANVQFVNFENETFVLVREYSTVIPDNWIPDPSLDTIPQNATPQDSIILGPCGTAPEFNTEPACNVPGTLLQVSQCEVTGGNPDIPAETEALLIEENGSYKVEMKNQAINCGYDLMGKSTFTMTRNEDKLKATLHMNGYPAACYAVCTLTIHITPEQATATSIAAIGYSYGSGSLKIVNEYTSVSDSSSLKVD